MSSNMSTGQIAGYVIGAVVGYFVPVVGISLGASIGGALGGLADPPKGPTVTSVGPRLTDQSVQGASYGAVIPDVYGSMSLKGNVIWVENNKLKETVTTTTTRSGGKGGGGGSKSTSTTYTYSATFAVGLCKGPIAGIRRIWAGSKLIYDANATDMASIIASNALASGFTIYTGSDTQNPDPRMQAALGVANTPAYRGLAYIVFYDFQLRDYGNSLLGAQIKVELLAEGASTNQNYVTTTHLNPSGYTYSPYLLWFDGASLRLTSGSCTGTMLYGKYKHIYKEQVLGSTIIQSSYKEVYLIHDNSTPVYNSDGEYFVFVSGTSQAGIVKNGSLQKSLVRDSTIGAIRIVKAGSDYIQCGFDYGIGQVRLVRITESSRQNINTSFMSDQPADVFTASTGYIYIVGNSQFVYELDPGFSYTGRKFYIPGERFILMDLVGSVLTYIHTPGYFGRYSDYVKTIINGDYSNTEIYRTSSGHIDLDYRGAKLVSDDCVSCFAYSYADPITITFSLHPKLASSSSALSSILQSQCLKSKILSAGDLTFESISDTVKGFKVGSYGPIRRNIEPLQKAWPFDVFQSGYKIKFKSRGSASVKTIYDSDLGSTTEKSQHQFIRSRDMDSMIPNKVSMVFLDTDREYDAGEQFAERVTRESVSEVVIDMPIAMSSAEAAQMAEILLYIFWLEREDFSFKLPPSFIDLEPSDVITFNSATNGLYEFRITALNYTSNNILEVSAKLNSQATYYSTAVGESGQSNNNGVDLSGPSQGFALDIPLIDSAMNTTGLLLAAYGFSSTWPGCVVSKSIDDQSWFDVQSIAMACTIGLAANALPIGRTDIIDKLNVLTVGIIVGSLYSVSESLMLSGENHFAVGSHGRWEIIAAQTCTEISAGIYELTNLLRGRAGTEWAMSTHLIGDTVVLLDYDELAYVNTPANDLNTTRSYKFISFNSNVESTVPVSIPYTGVNLECLSPVYLNGSRNAAGDWDLSWVRRTRIGGEWTNGSDVPVSESFESYELDIHSDGTYATVVRTIKSSTQTCVYSAADQTTDFGSTQVTLHVKVYQMSELVGRGYPLQSSIAR